MPYITLHLDREELRRLRELAEAEDRTPAQQAKRLLRLALAREEVRDESVTTVSARSRTND
jgi:predicted transcriptional regulator